MMLNDTAFDYLYDFYGNSAKWFAIHVLVVSIFTISSDIFFIILTLTSKSLRENTTNWFLLGFSLSDLLHSVAHSVDAYALWYGSVDNRHPCAVAGVLVICTATCSLGYPMLIAAERYYKISTLPQSTGRSIGRALFSRRATIPLIIGWYIFCVVSNLPLMLTDAFGEDPGGYCGTKKFTSAPLLISYELSVVLVFYGALTITAIYYYRLVKWLKKQESLVRRNSSNNDAVDYTSGVMRVMKIVTVFPFITVTPCGILTGGQMILPDTPMWINRLFVAPYFLSSAANPWLTIFLVKQFRVRFLQLVSNIKNAIPTTLDGQNNRSSNVQRQ